MSYMTKLALLTMVVCAAQCMTINPLVTRIGSGANGAFECMDTMLSGVCKRDIKLDQNEPYYCCVLWDLTECFEANYKTTCTPEDAAEFAKHNLRLLVDNHDAAECTADHYGQEISRDICKV